MNLKRILMTADTVGGVWTYALELAQSLSACGVGVVLATMGRRPSRQQLQAAADIPGLELCESDYKLEWMEDPWRDVDRAGEWLLELERQTRPELVHLNSYAHGVLPWQAPKIVVAHSCVLSWWRAVHGEDAPAQWQRYRETVTAGLHAADLVIAPTYALLECLQSLYGPLPATAVIPNGKRPGGPLRCPKEPLVLSAGRLWDAAKNLAVLDQVAAELAWPICLAGETTGPDGARFENSHLRLLGHLEQPELARWLDRAAIYAAPAKYEPFGLAILEAALAGCTLVLGNIPSLRELWADAAVFVDPEDAEGLSEVLHELLAHPIWRAALSRTALARAGMYSPEAMASRYHLAYQRVLHLSASPEELYPPKDPPVFKPLQLPAVPAQGRTFREVEA